MTPETQRRYAEEDGGMLIDSEHEWQILVPKDGALRFSAARDDTRQFFELRQRNLDWDILNG